MTEKIKHVEEFNDINELNYWLENQEQYAVKNIACTYDNSLQRMMFYCMCE